MGQSYGIDVGLLHQSQVLQHALFAHHACRIGVVLVAVHATYLDGLPVDKQLSVLDIDGAKAHLQFRVLDGFPIRPFQFQPQGIEVRLFATP